MRSNPSPVRTRLSHRRQFSVIAKMNQLKPPLAVVERDDEDFMFFSSIDDVLGDPFDVLRGEAYYGWDAAGQYFSVIRRYPQDRWWHKWIPSDRSFLELECVRRGFRIAEAETRIRRFLGSRDSHFAGLLTEGLRHPTFGAVKR